MNRFFVERGAIADTTARITGEDVKHISRVLRMRAGEELMLCDGEGGEYLAAIESFEEDAVRVRILDVFRSAAEAPYNITLIQSLPKAGKMETIIQKCVELGAKRFIPVRSERSVILIKEKEFEKKRVRYNRVAQEAAKQSRRGMIPEVEALCMGFEKLPFQDFDLLILADEEEQERNLKSLLRGLAKRPESIGLIIGPEGGISRKEAEFMKERGAVGVTLGKRILRTETAGMALLSMLQYELEG